MSDKLPGSAEPEPGKCGAFLKKRSDECGSKRYCTQEAGFGTVHLGSGSCKLHGGRTPNAIRSAARKKVAGEIEVAVASLSERLGKPAPLRDPEIELWELAREITEWRSIIRDKMDELNNSLVATDIAGIERTRALVEQLERAQLLCRDTYATMMKMDLRRRVVELQEKQGQLIAMAVLAVLRNPELGLTDDQMDLSLGMLRVQMAKIAPQLQAVDLNVLDVEEIVE